MGGIPKENTKYTFGSSGYTPWRDILLFQLRFWTIPAASATQKSWMECCCSKHFVLLWNAWKYFITKSNIFGLVSVKISFWIIMF